MKDYKLRLGEKPNEIGNNSGYSKYQKILDALPNNLDEWVAVEDLGLLELERILGVIHKKTAPYNLALSSKGLRFVSHREETKDDKYILWIGVAEKE